MVREKNNSLEKRRMKNKSEKEAEIIKTRQEMQGEFLQNHPEFKDMDEKEIPNEMRKLGEARAHKRNKRLREHLELFNDAIIAIITTVMLLEIPIPTGNSGYGEFLESIGIFLVSFFLMADFWITHHKMYDDVDEITDSIVVFDFIFMAILSVIPLLTKWIMVEPTSFAVLNYGVAFILIRLSQGFLNYAISKERFKGMKVTGELSKKISLGRLLISLIWAVILTIFGYINPNIGRWLFITLPILSFIFMAIDNRKREEYL